MSSTDVKKILEEIKADPESVLESGDGLDEIIRSIIQIEKKHLFQVESTSARKRLDDIRDVLEKELPKLLGLDHAS